ncbi:hypothetical protein [Streptomyces sp. Z26]|uniref:hypothetical protein n=1 Tax=Streptomyces sp. Z26 TaxID=2500177 RepID=UPI000EF16AC7|nr:hypothetical protein [Streptomyces sp. Z26]RLL67966.1 hypothetical protein D7M15_15200 [Streptomyces sp. Z26]
MSEKDEPNEPLPVMSEKKSEAWARHFAASMARSARVMVDDSTERPKVQGCTGKNGETAGDGRFSMDYAVRAPLPVADHATAVGRVREALEERGYEITGYQELQGDEPSVILEAVSRKDGFSVAVEGLPSSESLLFSVSTPCLLPPGAKQEKV